jgi:hypothetical protein
MNNLPFEAGTWLSTNAPAAWITAIVALGGLIYSLWKRDSPKKAVIKQMYASNSVTVWDEIRDKVSVYYDENKVHNIYRIDFELFNNGSQQIMDLDIQLIFPQGDKILAYRMNPKA